MGNPAPEPGDYSPPGYDCITCYDPGLTPRFVVLTFGGIQKCDDAFCIPLGGPMNGAYVAEQNPDSHCRWIVNEENLDCWWQANIGGGGSMLALNKIDPEETYFSGIDGAKCVKAYNNANLCGDAPPECYFGGTGLVSENPVNLPGWLMFTACFEPTPTALNDTFEVDGSDDVVVRIVDEKTPTNIKIRYSFP